MAGVLKQGDSPLCQRRGSRAWVKVGMIEDVVLEIVVVSIVVKVADVEAVAHETAGAKHAS